MTSPLREPSAPWWRRMTLRDVIVFTLPPMALALWLFGASVVDYHRIRQFDDWWASSTSVRKFGWHRVRTALRAPAMAKIERKLSAEREDLPQLRLLVDRAEWDRIDSDVGAHWGEWIDVNIADAGQMHDAKLRFRGDGSAHWSTEKKSFTLKTKSGELYKGFRTMAFSVKDVLPQWLVAQLAKEFDLLAPEQQIVPVFLNDRFYGVHRFVEVVDESLLRRNLRMPGNVFRGDTAERGDYFKGLPREVFKNPFIWDRAASNDRPGAFGTSLLSEFIADLNTSTFEEHERFMEWLDRDELSRLLAFLLIAGDPYHMSGIHNQFWDEDPTSGKLHPVVWDVRLLDLENPPPRANINRFWRAALKDPRIWDGAMREIAKRVADDDFYQRAEIRVNAAWKRFGDAFEYDTLRSGVIPPVGDPRTTLATLRKNLETLRGWVDDARARVTAQRTDTEGEWVIDVAVDGRAPCQLTMLGFALSDDARVFINGLYCDSNSNGVHDSADEAIEFQNESTFIRPWKPVRLPSGIGGSASELSPRSTHYRFFYADGVYEGSQHSIRVVLANSLTSQLVTPTELTGAIMLNKVEAKARYEAEVPVPQILSGEVHLSEDLIIPESSALRVEAGTQLRLDPDVSILALGRVEFWGWEHKPITIQRENPDLPWGVIALQGSGTNGSRFEHVKFLGGGGRQVGNVEYKGSVCVHNAFDVVFDHCEFAYNSRCDDLINIVKGEASITHSHFHHANADSIDYDMSGGLVAYNVIEGSGNDGLDLMTCWPRVIDNDIRGSGDKGISIGEDSDPLVFGNTIQGCVRGIEVKDRSGPLVLHNSITGCERGVYAHIKNWRYGEPGWPKLLNSLVAGNEVDYLAENGANLTLVGSPPGTPSDVARPFDLEWLLREQGIVAPTGDIGPVGEFELVDPIEPLVVGTFEENFVDPRDGWTMHGGVSRLVKRQHDLVATFQRNPGSIEHAFVWDFHDSSREYVLVLEIAGEGATEVVATALSPHGNVSAPLELAASPTEYRFATVRLPAREYDGLRLSAKPIGPRATLRLHGYRVDAWPRSGD